MVSRLPIPELWRVFLAAAALILLGTAILHAVDYAGLRAVLLDWPEGGGYRLEVVSLWWIFALQLAAVAAALGWIVVGQVAGSDGLLALAAVLLVADAALLSAIGGLSAPRSLLTAVCAGLVLLARVLRPQNLGGA
jgi:hypothetical protein